MNGMNLYNFLRGLPIRLTTHNVGNVDSIGNAVFLAGEHRYACPHSPFNPTSSQMLIILDAKMPN